MTVRALLHRWHRAMAARPAWTLGATGLLLVLLGLLCSRVTLEKDVGALLPDGPGSPREAARLLGEFGALNTLVLDLEVPGTTRDELAERGAQLADRLRRSGAFSEVYTGPSTRQMLAVGRVVLPRRLYLLPDPAAELERRLEPSRLKESLTALRAQLASPQAFAMKGELLKDPLGLNRELLGSLGGMAGDVEVHRGQLLSRDGKHLLLATTPRQSALDTHASAALLVALAQEEAQLAPGPGGPAVLRAVGGPRFATESAASVRFDVVLTMLTSAAALLALFFARFRSLRLLLLASLPLGFGMLCGIGATVLLQGHIHALNLAFGAVLIGVAIDYPIHLLNSASVHGAEPLERMARGLEDTWRSMWLGYGTTVFAFAALYASSFPGLRELAVFGGAGLTAAFVATLVLLPPLCARWGPKTLPGIPTWMPGLQQRSLGPWLASAFTLVLLVGSVVAVRSLKFDGELRNLDAQRPETLAEYEEVLARFGLRSSGSLIITRGRSAEEALRRNDAVAEALRGLEEGAKGSAPGGIGSILPALSTQAERARRLATLDVPAARARLAEVATGAGFSSTAFDGFWQEVEAVRDGEVPPLEAKDLEGTALEPLLQRLLRCTPAGCIAVTPLQSATPAQAEALSRSLPEGALLLDGGTFAARAVAELPRQLMLLSGLGLLLNTVLLGFAYRSLRLALVACLPCCLGMLGTTALLALLDIPLNLVSASALVLVLGCGVDYGIFVLQQLSGSEPTSPVESTGVLLASITTLAGFGTLVLASHRALQSLGVAVGLGILISAAAALFLLPGLTQALHPRSVRTSTGGTP
ncbi:MAG: MMPL family transporter [Myxococcaceae bacterium]|nr:MMPL family transporter [Myxococcaceae bacterium]MCI0673305.1 MMPL family transporter [Myxococcaceae bacterium]